VSFVLQDLSSVFLKYKSTLLLVLVLIQFAGVIVNQLEKLLHKFVLLVIASQINSFKFCINQI